VRAHTCACACVLAMSYADGKARIITMTSPSLRPDQILASQWRQIVNGAIDTAIISTDTAGAITSWNRGAELILGWSEEEMLGQTLDRIFTEPGQFAKEVADAISGGRGGGEEGWRIRKDD